VNIRQFKIILMMMFYFILSVFEINVKVKPPR